jgi:hypothetical protein
MESRYDPFTPFVGDPNAQVGEASRSVFAANKNPLTRTSRLAGMSPRHRLTTSMAGAVPYSQMTPDQAYFRESQGGGRWGADSWIGAHAPVHHMRRHPDGTVDIIRLEADGTTYLDLGGSGARDMGAIRP